MSGPLDSKGLTGVGLARMGAVLLVWLVAAPVASAATNFVWSGGGDPELWSDPANWASGAAPSGSVGTLTFSALTTPGCAPTPTSTPCYYGLGNDIAGLSAGGLVFTGHSYSFGGQPITLGSGGITVGGDGSAAIDAPLVLAADQTWSVDGSGRSGMTIRDLSGANALTIDVRDEAGITMHGQDETGPVAVTGQDPASDGVHADANGTLEISPDLNARDGQPVTVSDLALQTDGYDLTQTGPLTLRGAELDLTGVTPSQTLTANGALDLDASTIVQLDQPGDLRGDAGDPDAQLSATGPVNLGGAQLTMTGCWEAAVGTVFDLVDTTSSLTGQFAGVPDGALVSTLPCEGVISPVFRISYTANAVTATVIHSALYATRTDIWDITPSRPAAGAPVTITAFVNPVGAELAIDLAGNVSFTDGGVSIPGCQSLPVQRVLVPAVCTTNFAAAGTQHQIDAIFTPSDPSTWQGSASGGYGLGTLPATTAPTVTPPPVRLLPPTSALSGLSSRHPTFEMNLRTRDNAASIAQVHVRLPRGLYFASPARLQRGIRLTARQHARLGGHGGSLTITFARPVIRLGLRIGPAGLLESRAFARRIAAGHKAAVTRIRVSVTTAARRSLRLTLHPAIH